MPGGLGGEAGQEGNLDPGLPVRGSIPPEMRTSQTLWTEFLVRTGIPPPPAD